WVSGESLTVHLSSCLRPHFPSVATDGLICDSGVKLGDGSSDLSSSNSPFVLTLSFSFSEHSFLSISFFLSLLHTCSHTHTHPNTHTHTHTHTHAHEHTHTHTRNNFSVSLSLMRNISAEISSTPAGMKKCLLRGSGP